MTLVLEVVHVDGIRTRHRFAGAPLTIGRGVANDIVVDDPYADAAHVRLTLDGDGAVIVEDLGSKNGSVARNERVFGRVLARQGDVLRVGRTMLRFRDADESLPPALVDPPDVPHAATTVRLRLIERAMTTAGGLALATVTLTALGINEWLGSSARASAGDVVEAVLGYAALVALWAGLWALATRIILHQFRYFGHVAVVSVLVLLGLAWSVSESWLSFFFPDSALVGVLAFLAALALVGALVTGHLSLSSTMSRRRRRRAGLIVAGSLLAITALVSFTNDDTFSDVPKFPGVVKPIAPALIPTKSIDDFEVMTRHLKNEVDQLAEK